ncbi:hypothetical protein ACOJUR_04750 [Alicyclobacillus tolerans]|uniref:Uncharacterized protein n=1 Tax=Alicyclobacillus tolerans TaxID=90970 RepID=A0A1M6UUW4_9BACL|nr:MULTISPECIES: hypothetical protein [Alicyclobacillus]SHK72846.1 hypothetical protein SAMN05443507_1217 [Alicyclobacillus montanus]
MHTVPILGILMMVMMMFFMRRIIMGRHNNHHYNDLSEVMREIRGLRPDIKELKQQRNKEDF